MGKNSNRGKFNVRQVPQKIGPENWRKKLNHEQKKIALPPKKDKRLNNDLSFLTISNNFAAGLLVLLLLSTVVPQVEATSYSQKPKSDPSDFRQASLSLEQRLQAKMQIDPDVPPHLRAQLRCDLMPKIFNEQKLSTKHIERALHHPDFGIMCTSFEKISKRTGSCAFFSNIDTKIWLTYPYDTTLINHEFIHADIYLGNEKGPCPFNGEKDLFLPFHPKNEESFINYKKAIQKGYSRLHTFKNLLGAEAQGKKLSAGDKRLLSKYRDVAKDCPDTYIIIQPPQQYDNMIARGWKPGMGGKIPLYGATTKVLTMEKKNNQTITKVKVTDIAYLIANIPVYVKDKLENDSKYNNLPENLRIAEEYAYTCQGLAPSAYTEFFPELEKIVEANRVECFPQDPSAGASNSLN